MWERTQGLLSPRTCLLSRRLTIVKSLCIIVWEVLERHSFSFGLHVYPKAVGWCFEWLSDLLCQDKLKKTIFLGILFHENPFLESVSWCQVCERRNRLGNLVRDKIGRGGSRTLPSVLESIMIPRGEVSKIWKSCSWLPPLRTLLPPLSAMCWKKGLRHLECGFISHSALHSQSSALWVVSAYLHDYFRVSLRCSLSRLWQEANPKQTL